MSLNDVDMNPEAEPTMPEWKVYFEGNFWGHFGKRPCRNGNPVE